MILVSSLITFVYLIASAATENYFNEWRQHQRNYQELLFEKVDDDHSRRLARSFQVGLQQSVLPELGRVDRCISCHLGVDNPRMKDVDQPYRVHSGQYLEHHPIGRFGCTVCHRGQGRAVVSEEAKYGKYWGSWLLPLSSTQASCGICHDPSALEEQGAPLLALGHRLTKEQGCLSCHRLGNRGGSFGPSLDGLGAKDKHFFPMAQLKGEHTVVNWLYEHFLDPQAVVPDSRMKETALTEEEAQALTVYMLSLEDMNLPKEYLPSDKYRVLFESRHPPLVKGEVLYRQFCYGCHEEAVIGEVDLILEKELPSIRNPHYLSRISDQVLAFFIRRGRPGTDMQAWHEGAGGLRDEEIDAIVAYIAESRESFSQEAYVLLKPQDIDAGAEKFEETCSPCHGEAGIGTLSPSLVDSVFAEVYDDRLLGLTIRDGTENTGMPPAGELDLTEQDISNIIAYIRTLQ